MEMYACLLSKVTSVWNSVSEALHSCQAELHKHSVGERVQLCTMHWHSPQPCTWDSNSPCRCFTARMTAAECEAADYWI